MSSKDELLREVEALRWRISALSAASLRINASLELDTVLQEVLDSARTLTGARYACVVTVDDSGQLQDFVSSGLSADWHRRLLGTPDGSRLFEHFRDLPGVLRLADLQEYLRSYGLSNYALPIRTFQGTPMRHQGIHVGNFYLADKEDGKEFTDEDEEVLVLFASQAAGAIANARTYRAERLARADLEALVDTSPFGVLVFNAKTGSLVSYNREVKRMADSLQSPDRTAEQLLEVLSYRRADGHEGAVDQSSLPAVLARSETVRAEEIVLSVPDGRSVTTLVNATPIRDEDGAIKSVVVTLQDLASLQEMGRMRAEFLSMVSHELRAPLTSIKGSTATVLDAVPVFDSAEMLQFFRIIDEQADRMNGLIADLLDAGRINSGMMSVAPEPSDVGMLVDQARNAFLSGGARYTVLIDLPPDLPPVMADPRRIVQVLNNLFSNAARHAPESSPIRVSALRDGVYVAISVSDEGQGIAPERMAQVFSKYPGAGGRSRESWADSVPRPGAGGIDQPGAGSGHQPGPAGVRQSGPGAGLGLAICKGLVEAHGGRIYAESGGPGQGARFTFTVPVAVETDAVDGTDGSTPGSNETGREPVRILVVDDDPQMLYYVRHALNKAGFETLVTGDHRELEHIISTARPALVLLDLVLPGTDGIELMERIPALADLPVIFISGYRRDETIARALDRGATDYIVKPFSPTELTARIRAALRRWEKPEPFVLGELTIDYDRRRVMLAGTPLELTATEYKLLSELSLHAGRVLTYDTLLRRVWDGRHYGDPKLVRAFIKKLRQKLGDDANKPVYILTQRGVGYRMARPDDAKSAIPAEAAT